jgi:hypothetical protein
MRPIGFSSGALAYADFRRGVAMLLGKDIHYLELSALRENELDPLLDAVDELNLAQFRYIAIHAPSGFNPEREERIVDRLAEIALRRKWPVILHPDAVHDASLWQRLGQFLCIENMDKRKAIGRTAEELAQVFVQYPDASLCFDIGHARQVDATMTEAYLILTTYCDRLRQVHLSEVNTRSKHDPLSVASILAFRDVAELIPTDIPVILETPVAEEQLMEEIAKAAEALPVRELAAAS